MNPEDRETINPAELTAAYGDLNYNRIQFGSLKEQARDAFGLQADHEMNQGREDYEQTKGQVTRMNARMEADCHPEADGPTYRQMITTSITESLTHEENALVRQEVEIAAYDHNLLTLLNRHPWTRAAAGLGTAAVLSAASAADIASWSVPTALVIGATAVVGFDGAIHGVVDYLQTHVGLRSRPHNLPSLTLHETEVRLAHLQENRVETGQEGPTLLETDLTSRREELIRSDLISSLQTLNVLPRTGPGHIIAERIRLAYRATGENLSLLKQHVLEQNRMARRVRLGTAAVLAIAGTIGASYLPLPESPSSWVSDDPIYAVEIGDGTKSSRHGFIQSNIAREVVGITDFDPFNSSHSTRFEEYKLQHPIEYARLISAFDRWFERHNRSITVINGDLIEHNQRHMVPADPKHFVNGVLGEFKSPLDHIRFSTYRW